MAAPKEADVMEEKAPCPASSAVFKIRDDWYQSDTHVVINILVKNLKNEDVNISYGNKSLTVDLKLPDKQTCFMYKLSHPVVPSQSSHRVLSSKIEVKLKKVDGVRWEKLETENGPHPSESKKLQAKNWDKVVASVETEEDKPQGEAALNSLFQQIYGEGSDDVRRAMNKSFVESGGTVLSTQWSDVKEKPVEVKPPDGLEYRKWND